MEDYTGKKITIMGLGLNGGGMAAQGEGAWPHGVVGGQAPCSGRIFSCFVHALCLYIFPRGKGVL